MSDLQILQNSNFEVNKNPFQLKEIESRVENIYKEYQMKKGDYISYTRELFSKLKESPKKNDKNKNNLSENMISFVNADDDLKLSNSELKYFHSGIEMMIEKAFKTGKLQLSNLGLTVIPDCVWQLDATTSDGNTNQFINLLRLKLFQKPLTDLDLSFNVITEFVPKNVIRSLKVLWVERSLVQYVSEKIGLFTELRVISLADNLLTDLPISIGFLPQLEELYLEKNMFYKISKNILNLKSLRELNFSFNELAGIPPEISSLVNLEKLCVAHNYISALPIELQKLPVLKYIDISYNCVYFLPNLSGMPYLHTVDASYNSIVAFPTLIKCPKLAILNFEHNRLQEVVVNNLTDSPVHTLLLGKNNLRCLPENIHLLTELEELDLHNNRIKILPNRLSLIKKLTVLKVDANAVYNVDDESLETADLILAKLMKELSKYETIEDKNLLQYRHISLDNIKSRNVEELVINDQNLFTISDTIINKYKDRAIERIDLSRNKFSYVPVKIKILKDTVTELIISDNCLKSLPDFLGQMENLRHLDISNNLLEDLPKTLKNCTIEVLLAAKNNFKIIPRIVYTMKNLQCLNFSGNKITNIDVNNLRRLQFLKILHLSNNMIREIPVGLLSISSTLKRLTLLGNPLKIPDHNTIEEGTEAIMSFLRCKKDEEQKNKKIHHTC